MSKMHVQVLPKLTKQQALLMQGNKPVNKPLSKSQLAKLNRAKNKRSTWYVIAGFSLVVTLLMIIGISAIVVSMTSVKTSDISQVLHGVSLSGKVTRLELATDGTLIINEDIVTKNIPVQGIRARVMVDAYHVMNQVYSSGNSDIQQVTFNVTGVYPNSVTSGALASVYFTSEHAYNDSKWRDNLLDASFYYDTVWMHKALGGWSAPNSGGLKP